MLSQKGKLFIAFLTIVVGISFMLILTIVSLNGIENFKLIPVVAVVDAILYLGWLFIHRERLEI